MKQLKADVEVAVDTDLGEGPIWNELDNTLYFVDITGFKLYAYKPSTLKLNHWNFPSYTSSVINGVGNHQIVAAHDHVYKLNTSDHKIEKVFSLSLDKQIRFNDCKSDRLGRLWLGTMDVEALSGKGGFYCIDKFGATTKVLLGLTIPNGFCWSMDHKYIYHIDSIEKKVKRFEYDETKGLMTNPQIVIEINEKNALPDGMCIDRNGNLWIALWGGGQVACYNPKSGEVVAKIIVPAPHVTSCTFGGNDFNKLFITTAKIGLSDAQLSEFPLSGSVFSCDVAERGIASNKCLL